MQKEEFMKKTVSDKNDLLHLLVDKRQGNITMY